MTSTTAEPVTPAPHNACPICDRRIVGNQPLPYLDRRSLYGVPICDGCWRSVLTRRFIAFAVDACVFLLIASAMPDAPRLHGILVYAILYGGSMLFAFKDGFGGMSPGKWMLDIQVVDRRTLAPVGFVQSFKRNVCLIAPALVVRFLSPLIAIYVAYQIQRDGRRLGDGWADTMVIWRRYAHRPPFDNRGAICHQCGYDLTGNVSGVCPECGTGIPLEQRPDIPNAD